MSQPFLRRLRRLLLLIPAAWKAGEKGLPVEKAVAVTGARSARELREDVAAAGSLDLAPSLPEDFLAVSVEGDRVFVDSAMRLLQPPPLSLREGAALMAALRPFERDSGKTVAAVLRKLRHAIPGFLRPEAEQLARGADFQIGSPGEWAEPLEEALERRVEVTVEYRAEVDGTVHRRTLEPRLLIPRDGHWYLAAWNVEKGEEHLYRLDRIVSVAIGSRLFGEHKGPAERYLGKRMYVASGSEREVTVRFTSSAARLALEHWAGAEEGPNGSVTLKVRQTPGNYLYGWVLQYGGQAEVVAPEDVRQEFLARVERVARLYR